MIFNRNQPSAVILFVLMTLSIIVLLTEQLIRSTIVGSSFTKTMIDREHAEMLALGGVNIAIAQLSAGLENEQQKSDAKNTQQDETTKAEQAALQKNDGSQSKEETPYQKFLFTLFSNLNRWQTFTLDQTVDGIDGNLKICVCSEHGKINLNEAFDFKKQEFKKEYEALLKKLEIPGRFGAGEMFNKLTDFFKNRKKKLYDVTELMYIPGFNETTTFYQPPEPGPKGKGLEPNIELFLQDIFTVSTDEAILDPLVFSDSLCAIFSLRRPQASDAEKMKEQFKQLCKEFKKDWGINWEENWKFLQPIYGEKPQLLPAIKDILAKKFSSKVYSVLSYGKVNQVEQRVLAIVKEVEVKSPIKNTEQQNEQEKEAEKNKKPDEKKEPKSFFKIMKLYWL